MDKTIALVYQTRNYAKFKKLESNRAVLKGRKEKLIESFEGGYILNPIVINEKNEIIDGQGRYEACKELGLPICYVVDEGTTIEDCRRMNSYNTPWKSRDFVESFADDGNENYIIFLDVLNTLNIPVDRALRLAGKGGGSKCGYSKYIRAGKLIFTEDDANKVKDVYKKANEISQALLLSIRLNEAFYTGVAVINNYPQYDHRRMVQNAEKCRNTYRQMANLESQLKEFSRIYNYKASKNRIYFEDYMRNRGYNVRNYDESYFGDKEDVSTLKKGGK